MSTKPKRQFVTIIATKTFTANHAPMTIAVDTIAKIEDIAENVPIYKDGTRSWILLKGKDGDMVHCDETRAVVLAKIEEPAPERSALMRFKWCQRYTEEHDNRFDWIDVIAIVPRTTETGQHTQEWIVRTPLGLLFWDEEEAHDALGMYEEV
jgi:hypothetical protein